MSPWRIFIQSKDKILYVYIKFKVRYWEGDGIRYKLKII